MPRHRKTRGKKGGGIFGPDAPPDPNAKTWSETISEYTPSVFKSKPVSPPPQPPSAPLPEPLAAAVSDSQEMAQTAGRRIKKYTGYNPASSKSMRKLFGTAKGDNMLGGKRRRRRTHRR
jgi:hypothetical protein